MVDRKAVCHPNRKYKAKGMCNACYLSFLWTKRPQATCHPEKKQHAAGLCRKCYRAGKRQEPANEQSCGHVSRKKYAFGLCRKCYDSLPERKAKAVKTRRLKKYKLSEEAYATLLTKQNNLCAICQNGPPEHIDHDHKQQDVRGLLCHQCNIGLGNFKDNPSLLQRAVFYLNEATNPNNRSDAHYIETFRGKKFWPNNPRPEDVDIYDIAHALSMQCRWTGHCRVFYSVAEHSVRASRIVPPEHAMTALLHDASEAYLIDLARPVKNHPDMQFFKVAEDRIQKAIAERFEIPYPYPESVHKADGIMLMTEKRDLMGKLVWSKTSRTVNDTFYPPLPTRIRPWTPEKAEEKFLDRFVELDEKR